MSLTAKQIRGIRYARERKEREKELDTRANYGAIAGADLAAAYDADRSLVECWMDSNGDVFCPACRHPRNAFRYSSYQETRCAGCRRTVGEGEIAARQRRRSA
jgi:hypothetical protein